jgi:hypothetical protein
MSGVFFTHGKVDLSILQSINLRVEEVSSSSDTSIISISSANNQAVGRTSNILTNQTPVVAEKLQFRSTEEKKIDITSTDGSTNDIQMHKAQTYATKKPRVKDFPGSNYVFSLEKILSQPQDCVGHSSDLVLGDCKRIFSVYIFTFYDGSILRRSCQYEREKFRDFCLQLSRNESDGYGDNICE